jgi:hypothetical protein
MAGGNDTDRMRIARTSVNGMPMSTSTDQAAAVAPGLKAKHPALAVVIN